MSNDALRAFVVSKLSWIRKEQRKIQAQPRRAHPLLINRESHWVWGQRYLLEVVERDEPPFVELNHRTLMLFVRPGSDYNKRKDVLAGWYRQLVRDASRELIPTWEARLGVSVEKLFVQRMKTKWGSCNSERRFVRLNTELAKKPRECLEYILVHEMAHIHEPTHNIRFRSLLDNHMPKWREVRDRLNRQPLAHEEWGE